MAEAAYKERQKDSNWERLRQVKKKITLQKASERTLQKVLRTYGMSGDLLIVKYAVFSVYTKGTNWEDREIQQVWTSTHEWRAQNLSYWLIPHTHLYHHTRLSWHLYSSSSFILERHCKCHYIRSEGEYDFSRSQYWTSSWGCNTVRLPDICISIYT